MTMPSIESTDAAVLQERDARTISRWQRLYWSLRREVWEYRPIWIAPVAFGVVVLLAFLTLLPALPQTVAQAEPELQLPYVGAALAMFAATFLVGVFFCLEALQGERRDRSILFWKSMPISDGTTVLSKAMIPLVVLPLVAYSMSVILHAIMLVLGCAVLLVRGGDVRTFVAHLAPIDLNIAVLYAVIAIALWHAPIYGWLLFMSSWARRAALVWAFAPLLAIAAAEWMILGTTDVISFVPDLVLGWTLIAFAVTDNVGTTSLVEPTPGELLRTPSLWIGLVFAILCIVGAVYMRRYREPG